MRKFSVGFVLGLLIFIAANLPAAHFLSDCGLTGWWFAGTGKSAIQK